MKDIKNIIFDLGVVILNLDRERCANAFKSMGTDVTYLNCPDIVQREIFDKFELGEISASVFYERIRSLIKKETEDEIIKQAWLKMLCDIPQYKLDFIRELKKDYKVYLLSNTNETHWEWCKEEYFEANGHSMEDFFDGVFLSYEMHLLKPDKEIFEKVIIDTGISSHETLFIDDSVANCQSAMDLGFHTYTAKENENWTHIFNS